MRYASLDLSRSEQFEAWRNLLTPLLDIAPAHRAASVGFSFDVQAWNLESLALVEGRMEAFHYERTARHARADSIDHWIISCRRDEGFPPDAEADGLAVWSLANAFSGLSAPQDGIFLFVPREFCQDATGIIDGAEGRALTSGLVLLLRDYLLDLARRLPMLTEPELPGVLATTRTMMLACLAPSSERLEAAQRPIDVTLLERARRLIQDELLSPRLSVDMLCRQLGVSRSRLYRLFEPAGGVAHYIRARRLLDAHVSLADTHDQRRIADIAADRGFLDAAEFSRAFKREFGYTPSEVRRDASRGPMRGRGTMAGGRAAALIDLLRSLRPAPTW